MEAFYHEEGRVAPLPGDEWQYEYNIKDHLGNGRAYFRAGNTNNGEDCVVVLQEAHYYPFGLSITGLSQQHEQEPANKYQYNGKELNDEFGLHWNDYGARWYDPAVGRWWSVGPLAEEFYEWSGYHYVYDNPINGIDPDGRYGLACRGAKLVGKGAKNLVTKGKLDVAAEAYGIYEDVSTLVGSESTGWERVEAGFNLLSPLSTKELKAAGKLFGYR